MRKIRQRADIGTSMTPVAFVQLLSFEMPAVFRFDLFAAQPVFDSALRLFCRYFRWFRIEIACGKLRGEMCSVTGKSAVVLGVVLRIDARYACAEIGQLLL